MKFDKYFYKQEKAAVIELIKNSHDWENTEGFIADGIISPENYENEPVKVLVMLAESYGYDESGMFDIEDQRNEDILGLGSYKVQAPRKITTLLWLLFKSLEKGEKITFQDFPTLFTIKNDNFSELQNILSRIAWVNVKKASKNSDIETKQDYEDITRHSYKNHEILSRQVVSIAPDLIIACSRPVMLTANDMGLLGDEIQNIKFKIQTNTNGQKVIYVSHPSYYTDWGYKGVYKIYEIIYDSLVQETKLMAN